MFSGGWGCGYVVCASDSKFSKVRLELEMVMHIFAEVPELKSRENGLDAGTSLSPYIRRLRWLVERG